MALEEPTLEPELDEQIAERRREFDEIKAIAKTKRDEA